MLKKHRTENVIAADRSVTEFIKITYIISVQKVLHIKKLSNTKIFVIDYYIMCKLDIYYHRLSKLKFIDKFVECVKLYKIQQTVSASKNLCKVMKRFAKKTEYMQRKDKERHFSFIIIP